ncbi:FecR family protein [Pricia antarctica]|uniref:FecR family protein n=1 Tax=Pricia antarctica TaxID=641691 RepID=A0A1G7C995_9FLAO|nr:FecR domain-containing protein [Pricia antarctica]SDE35256.1 FecR family protein [Pricia antarctica]
MKTTKKDKPDFLAKWIIGEITDADLKKLVSEEDFEILLELRTGTDLYRYLEVPIDPLFDRIKNDISKRKKQSTNIKTIPLFAKVALAVAATVLLFLGLSYFLDSNKVTEQSGFGEQRSISLIDGSRVIINAKSELTYNSKSWDKNRELYLKGEAFFKVKKGKTFTVRTNNGSVTVLGTQFDVNSFNDFFEVTCFEGSVKVVDNNNENEVIILPGQAVKYVGRAVSTENLSMTQDVPSWVFGESSFRKTPLKNVIRALENQYNVQVNLNGIDGSIIYTGSFTNDNLEMALASIFKTIDIEYTVRDNKIVLHK